MSKPQLPPLTHTHANEKGNYIKMEEVLSFPIKRGKESEKYKTYYHKSFIVKVTSLRQQHTQTRTNSLLIAETKRPCLIFSIIEYKHSITNV